jgi:hypothetical protein
MTMFSRVVVGALCIAFLSAVEAGAQARITASTMDSNGNVYVTGWRTVVTAARWEMATTKYDRNGLRLWTHAYPGDPARPDAESWGIAADAAGNVYVAAHVTGTHGVDCLLIKYPSDYTQGAEPAWVRTWDGGLSDDQNWTIALDVDGFIYVTGYSMQSHGGAQSADIVTMKYDSQGNLVWNRLYSGTGDGNENGYAIVVDPVTKNVYVTGTSLGAGPAATSRDMITISYDSAGTERWVQRYTGPVIGLNRGTSLALDAEGSVYVTGWSQGMGSIDYATIKYDVSGHEIWVARYDGPGGGNDQPAPPAGGTQGSAFASYVHNNQGIIVTTEVLDPAPEIPYLATRVVALGLNRGLTNSLLVKLDACLASLVADNAAQRQNAANVLGAFVNQLQDLVAEGLLSGDSGAELEAVADQIGKGVLGVGTTVVYVTGQSTNAAGNVDFATVKYNGDDGRPMWNLPGQPGTTPDKPGNPADIALRYNGPGNGIDRAWAMAMDLDGDLYVAGPSTEAAARSVDFLTIKYFVNTYQPVVLGQARYNGPGNGADQACGFATWTDPASGRQYVYRDPATHEDFVAVTGNSIGTGVPAQEYTTIVYDGALSLRWLQRYHW